MAQSQRSAVEKYHDRVAPRYDHSYDDVFWQWHDALTWDYLKPHLPRDLSAEIVDLGCGTGKWAAKIAKSGFAVTCVDISRRMLDRSRAKLEKVDRAGKARFLRADLADLSPLPAGHFALAVALGDSIGCTVSPPRTLKQIRRILCEDGILIATFDNRLAALDFLLQQGDPREMSHFLRRGKTHWLTKNVEEQFEIVTYTPSGVVELVESGGFDVIELIGKTALPMRHYRHLLETAESRRAWAKIEKSLCRAPDAIGRASHIQITCRARAAGKGA